MSRTVSTDGEDEYPSNVGSSILPRDRVEPIDISYQIDVLVPFPTSTTVPVHIFETRTKFRKTVSIL